MKNPNRALKIWFGTEVNDITSLEVYDGMAPSSAGNEYVIITGRSSNQEQGKSDFVNTCTIILDIVTRNANFGYKRSEEISELIMAGINSDTVIDLGSEWDVTTNYISIQNLDGLNPDDKVFRTLVTYNLTVINK